MQTSYERQRTDLLFHTNEFFKFVPKKKVEQIYAFSANIFKISSRATFDFAKSLDVCEIFRKI
jgi:hypothetical protein